VSAAAAGVLTALFGSDAHFTVTADGLPGVARSFDSFGAAAAEAGQSRIYGGIHYQFDNIAGQQLGHSVADYVVGGFLKPRDDEGVQVTDAVGSAVSVVVTPSSPVPSVPPALAIQLVGPPTALAVTGSPVTAALRPTASAPARATESLPPGASQAAAAAPALRHAPQRPGDGPVSNWLLIDLALDAGLEPAW
jgi:hypothetical protein